MRIQEETHCSLLSAAFGEVARMVQSGDDPHIELVLAVSDLLRNNKLDEFLDVLCMATVDLEVLRRVPDILKVVSYLVDHGDPRRPHNAPYRMVQ